MKISNPILPRVRNRSLGFSLIELLVAIAIGMLLLIGLVGLFASSNQSYLELHKSAQQIESGRYAAQVLGDDLRTAGYYGEFSKLPDLPASLPDACATSALTATPYNYLALPVQAFDSPVGSPITSCLADKNFRAGTDIVLIRRAGTELVTEANPPVDGDLYIQARADLAQVVLGKSSAFKVAKLNNDNSIAVLGTSPNGTVAATVFKKMNYPGVASTLSGFRVAADVRKLHVHIYFVAPCSRPKVGVTCANDGTDDGGNPIPTLKRLELTAVGSPAALGWNIVPLVEGIDNLQVEYGVDNDNDGAPDAYVSSPTYIPPNKGQLENVVAARLYVLARSVAQTPGYGSAPGKAFCMASLVDGVCPSGKSVSFADNYKRHLYVSEVRLNNPGGRRETP